MKLFGKQVSLAVLVSFVVGIVTSVTGLVTLGLNNWGKTDPASFVVLISGALVTAITAAIHTWDTMPNNIVTPTPAPAPGPVAGA